LLQVAQIVLIKEPDVGRAGTEHRQSFDATAEGEALVAGGVVADASKYVWMDHPAASGLDPAVSTTHSTCRIFPLAREAVESDLGRRLGEREIVDAKADLAIAPEDLSCERVERALEVGHRELLVDREALVLEEDRFPDRIGRLVSVTPARNDDADRRLSLFHDTHLH